MSSRKTLARKDAPVPIDEQVFRLLAESSLTGIYLIQDQRFRYVNQALASIFGYQVEELIDRLGPLDLTHPDDRPRVVENIRRRVEGEEEAIRYEFRGLRKDGAVIHVEVHGRRVEYEGRPAIIGTLIDLTARRQAEEALREAGARLRAVIEQEPLVTYTEDAESGRILFISPQIESLSGYSSEEWINQPDLMWDIIHPEDRPEVEKEDEETDQSGAPFRAEYRILTRSGEVRWVHDQAALIRDDKGQPLYWQGFILDITERVKAETRYRQLFDSVPVGLYRSTPQGKLLDVNRALVELLGYPSREALLAVNAAELYAEPEERERWKAAIAKQDTLREYKYRVLRQDGSVIWVQDTARAVRDEQGNVLYYEGSLEDITERKRHESLLQAQAMVSQALSETLELRPLLERILEAARQAIPAAEKGSLALLEDQERLKVMALSGYRDRRVLDFSYPLTWGYAGRAARLRQPLLIQDVQGDAALREDAAAASVEEVGALRSAIVVPLQAQERLIGVVSLESGQPYAFGEADLRLLVSLAGPIALAIENARLFAETRRRADELTALYETSRLLTEKISMGEVLSTIAESVQRLLGACGAGLYLYDPSSKELEVTLATHPTIPIGTRLALGEGLAGKVALARRPMRVEDYQTWEGRSSKYEEMRVRAVLEVPLIYQDELIGVLVAHEVGDSQRKFTQADERLLSMFAVQAAAALQNARLFGETRRYVEETSALLATSMALSSLDLDEILATIGERAKTLFAADGCRIFLLEPDGETLRCVLALLESQEAFSNLTIKLGQGVTGAVALSGQAEIVNEMQNDPRAVQVPGTPREEEAIMFAPLKERQRTLGVISVRRVGKDRPFRPADLELLKAFAALAASAVSNARLYRETRRRLAELETLQQVSAALRQAQSTDEMIPIFVQQAARAVGAQAGSIYLLDEASGDWVTQGWVKDGQWLPVPGGAIRHHPGEGVTGYVGASGEIYITADWRTDPITVVPAGEDQFLGNLCSGISLPLRAEARVIGVMHIWYAGQHLFTEDEKRLLAAIADMAGNALMRARLFEETRRRLAELDALHHASQALLAAHLDPQETYAAIHQAVARVMPCEAFIIVLEDPQDGDYQAVYLYDKGERYPPQRLGRGQGLSGHVIQSGEALIVDDFSPESDMPAVHFGHPDEVRSILAVPLRSGQKVVGMISAQSYQPRAYTQEQRALLETLAAQFAVTIENTYLYQQMQARLREMEAVNRISSALRTAQSADEVLPLLLDEILAVLNSDTGAVLLYHAPEGVLRTAVARGWMAQLDERPIKPGEGLTGAVFLSGETMITADIASDSLALQPEANQAPPGWSGAVFPIRSADETLGVLCIALPPPRQITAEVTSLLTSVAEMAGLGLHRMRLYEQTLRRLAYLQALQAVDRAIIASLDVRITLNVLLDHTMTQLKVDAAGVLLLERHLNQLEYAAGRGFSGRAYERSRLWLGEGLAGRVALERRLLHVANLADSNQAFAHSTVVTSEGFVSYVGVPLIAKGQVKGVLEVFHRTPLYPDEEWLNFLEALAQQAAIAIDNAQLFESLQRSNLELMLAYDATIEGWSRALDLRDEETEGHTQRVTDLTLRLARAMGVGEAELVHIRRGALLHDIGKMGVPDRILLKPGPLTEEEKEIMRRHPQYAYEMLQPVEHLRPALDIPYCHHERWDGSGYPRRLKGEQIPLAARIFAVADVFDALTSDRPYRPAWSREAALEHIRQQAGKDFDPRVVEVFLRLIEEMAQE